MSFEINHCMNKNQKCMEDQNLYMENLDMLLGGVHALWNQRDFHLLISTCLGIPSIPEGLQASPGLMTVKVYIQIKEVK